MEQLLITEPRPHVVALEGGPCAGKTTALGHIASEAATTHTEVIVLPEVATGFMIQKQVDIPWLAQYDRPGFVELEIELLDAIVSGIKHARRHAAGTNAIIVADRCDIATYVKPKEYQHIINRLGYTRSPHLALVDKIAYMPSLAHHNAELYDQLMSTNQSRYESAAAARATCDRNRRTLAMHPGFEVFDHHDFDTRLRDVTTYVLAKSYIHDVS